MFELRRLWVRDGEDQKVVLQYRFIPLQIAWSKTDNSPIIQPALDKISFVIEENWTEWENVPDVHESDLEQKDESR